MILRRKLHERLVPSPVGTPRSWKSRSRRCLVLSTACVLVCSVLVGLATFSDSPRQSMWNAGASFLFAAHLTPLAHNLSNGHGHASHTLHVDGLHPQPSPADFPPTPAPAPPSFPPPPAASHLQPASVWPGAAAVSAALNGLPVVSTYHRCDLMDWHHIEADPAHRWPRKPDWNYHDTGSCVQYDRSLTAGQHIEREVQLYRDQAVDLSFFSIHHVRHVEPDGADVGGHLFIREENCFRRPSIIHTDAHVGHVIHARYGPTSMELRLNGTELHTIPVAFIDPARYTALHLAIMREGSARRAIISEGDGLTGQEQADREWLPKDVDWPGKADENGHRLMQPGIRRNWTERVHGVDVCLYEADYSVSLHGVYEVRVLLLHVDFEDIGYMGHRKKLHRSQNAVLYRAEPRRIAPSARVHWPHPPDSSPAHPSLYAKAAPALSRVDYSEDDSLKYDDQLVANTARLFNMPLVIERPGWMAPVIGHSFLVANPGYDGRWVNVTDAALYNPHEVVAKLVTNVFWDGGFRRQLLLEWTASRPPFFFCAIQDPAQHTFIPFTFDQPQLPPPPITPSTPPLSPSPLTAMTRSQTWDEVAACLTGRRLAFLGDSQTRMLMNRIASTFMNTGYFFVKQRFAKIGEPGAVDSNWECIHVPTDPPVEPNDFEVRLRSNRSFELCYYPVSHLTAEELASAVNHTKDFDVIGLNSGQHAASGGFSISYYGRNLYEAFAQLEPALAPFVPQKYREGVSEPFDYNRTAIRQATQLPEGTLRATWPVSPAHAWIRDKVLWWSNQMYAHDMGAWPYAFMPYEHRTGRVLQVFNELARGLMSHLNIDQLDFTEAVALTFKDCATDGAHADWPFFEIFVSRFMEAITLRLKCRDG